MVKNRYVSKALARALMQSWSVGTLYGVNLVIMDSLTITRGIEPEIRLMLDARSKQRRVSTKRKKAARARTGRR